jgi:hypothetical protein
MPEAIPPPAPVKVDQAVYEAMPRAERRRLGRRSGGKGKLIVLRKLKTTNPDGKWDMRVTYRDLFRKSVGRNRWKRIRTRLRRAGVIVDEQYSPKLLWEKGIQI